MDVGSAVVPQSGQKVFDYRGSGLTWIGCYSVFFGLVFGGISAFMLAEVGKDYARDPSSVHGPLWIFYAGLSLFLFIGLGVIAQGAAYLLAVANEKIIVTPTELVWIGKVGGEKARCQLDGIENVQEQVFSQAQSNRYIQRVHHKCRVKGVDSEIVFSDNINGYEDLKSLVLSKQAKHEQHGVYGYWSPAIFLVAIFVIPATWFLCQSVLAAYVNGELMSVNGVMEETPFYVVFFVFACSAVFWAALGYYALKCLFERITVAGEHVIYRNAIGIQKVDLPLSMVEKDSYQEKGSYLSYGGNIYSVQTPQGRIKWSDRISGCTDLAYILKSASDQSHLGGGFDGQI